MDDDGRVDALVDLLLQVADDPAHPGEVHYWTIRGEPLTAAQVQLLRDAGEADLKAAFDRVFDLRALGSVLEIGLVHEQQADKGEFL